MGIEEAKKTFPVGTHVRRLGELGRMTVTGHYEVDREARVECAWLEGIERCEVDLVAEDVEAAPVEGV